MGKETEKPGRERSKNRYMVETVSGLERSRKELLKEMLLIRLNRRD